MNILLIDSAIPSSPFSGKTVRLKNIYGRLAREHKVYFLTTQQSSLDNGKSQEMESWVKNTFAGLTTLKTISSADFWSRLKTVLRFKPWFDVESKYPGKIEEYKSELRNIAEQRQIDLVVTLDNEVAQYGSFLAVSFPWVQDIGDSMIVQVKRQAEFSGDWQKRFKLTWRLTRETRFEREMTAKSNATVFVASDDASLYGHLNGKIRVIPNGVDADYFNPGIVEPYRSREPYVVFTGHMSFRPNQDAVMYFAKKLFPKLRNKIPKLGFKVVGADPSADVKELARIDGVEVTGAVPDIRPYLKGASAFVCPMRMGSGIKNKILEALAMELPVVATPLSIAGISGLPEGVVAVGRTPFDFMSALTTVIPRLDQGIQSLDSRFRGNDTRDLRKLGRKFVIENYSWEKTIAQYKDLFASLTGRGVSL